MPSAANFDLLSQAQALGAAAADANANAGSGNVEDPISRCPARTAPQDTAAQNTTLRIRLFNVYHVPIAAAAYTLEVDGVSYHGKTGRDGTLSQVVPGKPTSGTVTLDMWSFELTIDPLNPSDDTDGYAARLDNLGYFADDPSMALMRFQSANELDPSGLMDDKTKAKLEKAHGH